MKTKTINFLLHVIFWIILHNSYLKADTVFFDSKNIKIEEDGNIIISAKGTAEIPDQNISIEGDKFLYNKLISELVVIGNVKFFDKLNNVLIDNKEVIIKESKNWTELQESLFRKMLQQGGNFSIGDHKYRIIPPIK